MASSPRVPQAESDSTLQSFSQPSGHTFNHQIHARVRLATESDVPHLHKLIYHLALYHNLPFEATEASISNNLFNSNPLPPFESFTGLILEVSSNPFPHITGAQIFNPIVKTVILDKPIIDKEAEIYKSNSGRDDVFVAGYTLFYPHYFSFLEKPGFFIDNMYIRECYRSIDFGTMMFSVVASHAAKKGYSMVDGLVADWNVNSIKRFTKMGVQVVEDFRLYRVSGKGLHAYMSDVPSDESPNKQPLPTKIGGFNLHRPRL